MSKQPITIDKVINGISRWMVEEYCDSMGTRKPTGIADVALKPSEAKQQLRAMVDDIILSGMHGSNGSSWVNSDEQRRRADEYFEEG